METDSRKLLRLVSALGDLVAQEAECVASRDYEAVQSVQVRLGPVIDAIVALGPEAADAATRVRIGSLLMRRQASLDLIDRHLSDVRTELQALQASSGRAARIAPVYGRAGAYTGPTQFRAAV